MFVALLGFSLITAYYISLAGRRNQQISLYIFFVLMTLYTVKTFSRTAAWKDNYTLFTTDVRVSKNSAKCNVSAAESMIEKAEAMKQDNTNAKKLFAEAFTYLLHAQKIYPGYYGAYDLAGKAAFHLDDYNASFDHYKTCLAINPKAPVPVNNIYLVSVAASQKGNYAQALDMLLWLTDFSPDSLKYKIEIAVMYEKTGNVNTGIDTLRSVLKTNPNYGEAWAKLGEFYGKNLNDLAKAEEYLLTAYKLIPNDLSINENLGIVYGMKMNYEKSLGYFMKALAIDSTVARLHNNVAGTYKMMGNTEKANYHFHKALECEKK